VKNFWLFLFSSLFIGVNSFAINRDSILAITQTNIPDSEKIANLKTLAITSETIEEFYLYQRKAISLAEKTQNTSAITELKISEGNFYFDRQQDDKGMQVFLDEIRAAESKKDSASLSRLNYSVGVYYFYRFDIDNAVKFVSASVETYPSSEPIIGKANPLMALGVILQNASRFEESVLYQKQALKIKEDAGAWDQLPVSYTNLAELQYQLGQQEEAHQLLDRSIHVSDSLGIKIAYYYALFVKGEMYIKENRFADAIPLIKPAVTFWEETNSLKDLTRGYQQLFVAYRGAKMPYEAMDAMDDYITIKDSLFNIDRRNSANELAAKYESDKKELQIQQEKEAKEFAQKEKTLNEEAELMRSIVFAIIGVILIVNLIYFYKRYKSQQKDKELIAIQKEQIEARSQEIMDSIIYAKRIQAAILPRESKIKKLLPDSFIYYNPKDVVAGDFYWLEEVSDGILLAAADCTGHGVPGAMVSVVCNNSLNRAVQQMGITNPADVLNKTRELVADEFNKSEENLKDGMDIALCKFSGSKLFFAGAHNPLWIIRDGKLIELKGDKQPIGAFEKEFPFTSHETEIQKNDLIYIFTDGFSDQFGGDKGKKFKSANFKNFLLQIYHLPMQTQLQELTTMFGNWKGDLDQVDDVCVIGVRI
jgi:serine phosphatase RsbU (regulator of sigma subunit)